MENKRSDQLKHQPRGIIKWAPFNSLPEFTMRLKEKKQTNDEVSDEREEDFDFEDEWQ